MFHEAARLAPAITADAIPVVDLENWFADANIEESGEDE